MQWLGASVLPALAALLAGAGLQRRLHNHGPGALSVELHEVSIEQAPRATNLHLVLQNLILLRDRHAVQHTKGATTLLAHGTSAPCNRRTNQPMHGQPHRHASLHPQAGKKHVLAQTALASRSGATLSATQQRQPSNWRRAGKKRALPRKPKREARYGA